MEYLLAASMLTNLLVIAGTAAYVIGREARERAERTQLLDRIQRPDIAPLSPFPENPTPPPIAYDDDASYEGNVDDFGRQAKEALAVLGEG